MKLVRIVTVLIAITIPAAALAARTASIGSCCHEGAACCPTHCPLCAHHAK